RRASAASSGRTPTTEGRALLPAHARARPQSRALAHFLPARWSSAVVKSRSALRRGVVLLTLLVLGLVPAPARRAHALDATLATECATCEFPSVVSVAAQCTGVYVGHGMILTAAHCTDDVREGRSRVFFGEDIAVPAFATRIARCVRHPDGEFARNLLGEDMY